MNRVAKFFHELINPHCDHCVIEDSKKLEHEIQMRELDYKAETERLAFRTSIDEREDICDSCEILKRELAMERDEKRQLMQHILTPPVMEEVTGEKKDFRPILQSQHRSFSVIRQSLEEKDKQNAAAIRRAKANVADVVDTKDLEEAVLNAKTERENAKPSGTP